MPHPFALYGREWKDFDFLISMEALPLLRPPIVLQFDSNRLSFDGSVVRLIPRRLAPPSSSAQSCSQARECFQAGSALKLSHRVGGGGVNELSHACGMFADKMMNPDGDVGWPLLASDGKPRGKTLRR